MRLKYELETVDLSDEIIAVPVGQGADQLRGVLRLNQAGKEIFSLLKEETSEEEIIHKLSLKYENNSDQLTSYVRQTITQLKELNLIAE